MKVDFVQWATSHILAALFYEKKKFQQTIPPAKLYICKNDNNCNNNPMYHNLSTIIVYIGNFLICKLPNHMHG